MSPAPIDPEKWLCNAQWPEDYQPQLRDNVLDSLGGVSKDEYKRWFYRYRQGPVRVPPGSDATVEELRGMGLVGLYNR